MKTQTLVCAVACWGVAAPVESQETARSRAKIVADMLRAERATIEKLKAGDAAAERKVVDLLTAGDVVSWEVGASAALSVEPERRSPVLRAAMIEALRFEVELTTALLPAWQESDYSRDSPTETAAIMARELAAAGDPALLPPLAWHAYNAGPVAAVLYEFGLEAVPHLLEVALSPRAGGTMAGSALYVLASIVSTHGAGAYEEELVEAALLHMNGPPAGYMSAGHGRSGFLSGTLSKGIALAGALRTPALIEQLEAMAASTPEEIAARTGFHKEHVAAWAPACAQSQLDDTPPPVGCDRRLWVDMCARFLECRQFKLNRNEPRRRR